MTAINRTLFAVNVHVGGLPAEVLVAVYFGLVAVSLILVAVPQFLLVILHLAHKNSPIQLNPSKNRVEVF